MLEISTVETEKAMLRRESAKTTLLQQLYLDTEQHEKRSLRAIRLNQDKGVSPINFRKTNQFQR